MNAKKTFLLSLVTAATFPIQALWLPCAITKSLVRMTMPDFRTNRPYLEAVVLPVTRPSFREDLRQSWHDLRNGNTLLYSLHSMYSLWHEEEAPSPQELAEYQEDLRQIQEGLTRLVTTTRDRQALRLRNNSAYPSQNNIDCPDLQAQRIDFIMNGLINSGGYPQNRLLANLPATLIRLDNEVAARQHLSNNRE